MKCCDNEKSNVNENGIEKESQNEKKNKSFLSLMRMMVICCALPIVIIVIALVMGGLLSPSLKASLLTFAPYLCMILMIPMMFMMMKSFKER